MGCVDFYQEDNIRIFFFQQGQVRKKDILRWYSLHRYFVFEKILRINQVDLLVSIQEHHSIPQPDGEYSKRVKCCFMQKRFIETTRTYSN